MLALAHALALGVPARHAPGGLGGGLETGNAQSTALASRSGWTIDPRVFKVSGQYRGCPTGQRNAAENECLAAVKEATAAGGLFLDNPNIVKYVDSGPDDWVPSGCSYSKGHGQRAIFNPNPAGRSTASYPLVCIDVVQATPTEPEPEPAPVTSEADSAQTMPVGWSLDPRVYEEPGQFTGCPAGQRNAVESECLAAVQEVMHATGETLEHNDLKEVDAGAEGWVPYGCSYSRGHGQRAIFNRNPAGRNWKSYPLVCVKDEAHATTAEEQRGLEVRAWPSKADRKKKNPLNCTIGKAYCDLDVPVLRGAFAAAAERTQQQAAERGCLRVPYTVWLNPDQGPTLFPPPFDTAEGCAFAFVYNSSGSFVQESNVVQWTPVEIEMSDLPWPAAQGRRNSRVPKLLPHLFFPYPATEITLYIDAEDDLSDRTIGEMISSTISDCGASFVAQAHPWRSDGVMDEFKAIRDADNSAEPETLVLQEERYRNDSSFMAAVEGGFTRMLDGALLIRKSNDSNARTLSENWMRAYLRGADRDQPAFSYALEKSSTGPCRARHGDCDVNCTSSGFLNLVGSSISRTCRGGHTQPERPTWSSPPSPWVCRSPITIERSQLRKKPRSSPFTVGDLHEKRAEPHMTKASADAAGKASADAPPGQKHHTSLGVSNPWELDGY